MESEDRIAKIFENQNVLISGGTGYLGQVLIEKLLRCTNVNTIYLLLRPKKGRNPNDRILSLFENPLFKALLVDQPNVAKRCQVISGDIAVAHLNLSTEERALLESNVDFIFHSAATTRFDDPLPVAARINTGGTKYMLELAENCQHLKAFIHVSTAYAYPKEDILFERMYAPPAKPDEVLNTISWVKDDPDGKVTKLLLGDCPNSYTFTKALAESLVFDKFPKIPAIVCRPSLVVPIWRDPLPGWCSSLNGPMGLFVGAGKGVLRSMYMNSSSNADFIPADVAINLMLLATWNFVANRDQSKRIMNVTSSTDFKLSWEELIELGKDVVMNDMPFNNILWYPGGSMKKSKLHHNICFVFQQLLPALFVDLLLPLFGYKPFLLGIQKRIHKGGEMFEYYTNKKWTFDNYNNREIRQQLNAKESKLYKADSEGMNIREYFTDCIHSLRVVNLKETDEMLPSARRTMKIMWCVDRGIKLFLIAYLIYYFFTTISGVLFN